MSRDFVSYTIAPMALKITLKQVEFGIGDKIRVVQKIKDGDKTREAFFEGMVIAIRGREPGKTFVVRKIAEGGIGVEKIFPLNLPSIDRILIIKKGTEGVRRAKLYYTREKAPTEVEMIFKRAAVRASIKSGKNK
ncbi:MAG: 50S ribosomal protein L19 [Microgenomates group bacterium GW2011_GWC1_39_7b]|uniref:50S ribosomal protein L19 n=3 Tax=Candidatus Woeseibacteriota TaxID=1752722 RepID=A0A0G1F6A3_9BACT|nr:MAG: 50S ribosomal protein L19 [Microgenomates group bacterium GW2011_GWC1_39_7b]KKR73663.1 MAG: 50S ribosomal protein L19 [Candidatus Woesebacteria bacterium GW2011_GWA2_40_7]KKS90686.1 MAG: 50S ribosomal protein L19 [Candidatus Woesebacteria bacterium GW2011_GWA1_43_12]